MDTSDYQRLILKCLPEDGSQIQVSDLELKVAHAIDSPIDPDVFASALEAEALAEERTGRVRLIEMDLPEKELMPYLGRFLEGDDCLSQVDAEAESTVIEDTSVGGPTGAGMFSRPDFCLATVRSFRYDPRRYLDLISFELKNRRGATLQGVHETLAHTRFAHQSYYVFPRSRLKPHHTMDLQKACVQYGLGVITFMIGRDNSVGHFKIEHLAERGSPKPYDVDQFIDDRFSPATRRRLAKIAKG